MNILELDKKSVFILAGLLIIACVLIIGARKRAASIKTGIFLLVFTVLVSSCIVLRPAWGSLLPGNTTSGATDRTENTRIIGDVKNRLKVPAGQVTLWGEESLAELLPLARKLEAKKLVKINHYSSYNAGFFPVNAQAASINFAPLTAQELKELGLPAVIIVKTGTEVPEEIRQSASSIIRHRNRIAYIISK